MTPVLRSSASNFRSLVDSLRSQLSVVQPTPEAAKRLLSAAHELDLALGSENVRVEDHRLKRCGKGSATAPLR
jgi:hypothetical protein